MIQESNPNELIPEGVWKKTHVDPKPVGIPLWLKKDGKIYKDIHSGPSTFISSSGKELTNIVYGSDKDEEWLDTGFQIIK